MKIEIDMGTASAPGGAPAMLDIEELLATRLLVQGNSGSGKSHLLRRLLEQSAPHVQQVIIDPEGEFASLSDRYGHVVIDGERSLAELEHIAQRVRQHRVSAVLVLESLDAEMQMKAAAAFLNALFDAERDHWFPMLVVVDEAQLFAPAASGDVAEDARKVSLGAMTNLMCRGRKRGLAGIIATQRLAKLAKNVAAEASNFLMGRTFLDIDMARAADLLGLDRRQAETFRELQRGQFVALGPALSRRPLPIKVGPVETRPRVATPKLTPLPEAGEAARDLILAPVPVAAPRPRPERRAATPVPMSTTEILEQLVRERPAENAGEEAVPAMPPEELQRAFARIAFAILQEPDATFRTEAVLYQDFIVRCRIERLGGTPPAMAQFKFLLNAARTGLDPDAVDAGEWQRALDQARLVPADLQAVFLILAGAAMTGQACPADAEIARRCGSHSGGRARSQIRHLQNADFVMTRVDMRGARIAVIPDFGWETAPGDPNGPAQDNDGLAAAE
ncbi:helicase HerA domain-containing protein [Labrys miyagiensis]